MPAAVDAVFTVVLLTYALGIDCAASLTTLSGRNMVGCPATTPKSWLEVEYMAGMRPLYM